jgi:phosphoglycolate phosphatase-like HAD superfamily hydrolase
LFFRHVQFDQVPHGDAPGTKEGQPETVAMTFAVVFDLDGVLVDSESGDAARREVVARNGPRWQADATLAMMGMSSPEWSRYLHDQLGVPLEA